MSEDHTTDRALPNDFFQRVGTDKKPLNGKRRHDGIPDGNDAAEDEQSVNTGLRWAYANDRYWQASETRDRLDPGFYALHTMPNVGPCLWRTAIATDGLIDIPDAAGAEVMEEFIAFWRLKDQFTERGFLHKRGIMLWGGPGCLDAETGITYNAFVDGQQTFSKHVSIERLYQLFHGMMGPGKRRYQTLLPGTEIRVSSVDDEGRIIHNRVLNVVKSGVKPVYRVRTKQGLEIQATKDHEFLLSSGTYAPLEKLAVGQMVEVHINTNKGNGRQVTTSQAIISIDYVGERETYDIQMDAPYNNFVADKFVVHNSGKTATLMLMARDLVAKHEGIVCQVEHPGVAGACLAMIRRIEPHRPIVALIEDLDAQVEKYGEDGFLTLLDGETQVDGICYIATTNYPERLDRRFVDRPSRFDTIRWVGMPSPAARRTYLAAKDPSLTDRDLEQWVQVTEGFSIAHLRELVILVRCFGRPLKAAIARLDSMRLRQPNSGDTPDKTPVGFSS